MRLSRTMWKKLLALAGVVLVAGSLSARAEGNTAGLVVSTAVLSLVPPAGETGVPDWETGTTYVQGAVVVSEEQLFMCLVADGTSDTRPRTTAGIPLADGYRWARALSGPRHGLVIENTAASGDIYISDSASMSITNGLRLSGGGAVSFVGESVPQGRFYAVSTGSPVIVSFLEW